MSRQQSKLVRYVSPFGSPAWMTREQARQLLEEDDRRWLYYQRIGLLSVGEIQHGPPRIEHASWHSRRGGSGSKRES